MVEDLMHNRADVSGFGRARLTSYPTIQQLSLSGPTSGFDYLRIILAVSVVIWHSLETSDSNRLSHVVWHNARGLICLILPAFFALSGFLVCGSLVRSKSFLVFAANRIVRLMPALSVEILLSALLLGPLLTVLPLKEYFSSPLFWSYFLNVVGDIHFELPGVFLNNPTPGVVNRSLWTIPYELECYVGLMVLSAIGLVKRPMLLAGVVALLSVVSAIWVNLARADILIQVGPPGRLLVLSFLAGICLYLLRDRVRMGVAVTVLSGLAAVALLHFPSTMLLAPFPVALFTVSLGMMSPPRHPLLLGGDYSYGLYLFAYPIQQTYAALFPGFNFWYLNAPFAIVLGLAYAAFSWHVVEKPTLKRRESIIAALSSPFKRR